MIELYLRFRLFRPFRDFRGQIFLISDNVYYRQRQESNRRRRQSDRQIEINLLKQEKTCRQEIKGKGLKAAWDNNHLMRILQF